MTDCRSGCCLYAKASSLFSLALLRQAGEQGCSHLRDRLLESQREPVVEGLRAHNAVLTGVHDESSEARVGRVLSVELGQEALVVDSHGARNIIFAFKSLHLRKHLFFVLGYGVFNDRLENFNVALPAPQGDSWLDELDETLDEEVLEEARVLIPVISETLGHLDSSVALQTLDKLVGAAHAGDSLLVHFP